VDDKALVREMITTYLTSDGHTFETATNGREGLAKFKAGRFDVVITNRLMPDMDGLQLAVAIKQTSPNTPIIMLTATPPLDKPAEIDVILEKPVTLEVFRAGLKRVAP
jgi:CheY-like chemotaxis protein